MIDGMGATRKIKAGLKTFSQLSEQLLSKAISLENSLTRIGTIFDVNKMFYQKLRKVETW